MATLGKGSLAALKGMHPDLEKVIMASIEDTPVDFTITDGGRSAELQHKLWLKGRDPKTGNVVNKAFVVTNADGYTNKSNHQAKEDGFFHALDLYPYVDGKIDFNDTHNNLPIIAAHIKAKAKCMGVNIGWGGDWKATKTKPKGWDKPHFELLT